ncbi:MAG: (2Fe-2S)-binding protein [Kofleriaceae bacterium]
MAVKLHVNGVDHDVDADGDMPLLWALRDVLGMTGTKFGCGMAQCGACTVHLDGHPTRACVTPIKTIGAKKITTIEAIGKPEALHPVQEAWRQADVVQCGYCQSGQIMTAVALLDKIPEPNDQQIDEAMAGNICRCGTYVRVREAIHLASRLKRGAK